jgi:hypothetical protein
MFLRFKNIIKTLFSDIHYALILGDLEDALAVILDWMVLVLDLIKRDLVGQDLVEVFVVYVNEAWLDIFVKANGWFGLVWVCDADITDTEHAIYLSMVLAATALARGEAGVGSVIKLC